ncbi:MAG: hypothetical protein JO296_06140 [Pseudonocardiales bacterium]|nr:hypothetical protein [Pseudonocardiales bacterium]
MTFVAFVGFHPDVPLLRAADRSAVGTTPAPPRPDPGGSGGTHVPVSRLGIEQHLIIEGHLTPSAMRPLHTPPGCGTPVQAATAAAGLSRGIGAVKQRPPAATGNDTTRPRPE